MDNNNMSGAAIVGAAALSGAASVGTSLFGKKKAYEYNSQLQREQALYNQRLAEYQNEQNWRLNEQAYQQNVEQWKRENQANLEQWYRERDAAIQQWQNENKYNSPAEQMKRLQAAGINPQLANMQGNTAGSASFGDMSMASSPQMAYSDTVAHPVSGTSGVTDDMANPFAGISSSLSSYFNLLEQQRVHDKQIELWDAVIAGKNLDNDLKDVTFSERAAKYGLQNDNLSLQIKKDKYRLDNLMPLDKSLKETSLATGQINYEYLQNSLQDRLKKVDFGNKLMQSQIALNTSNKNLIDAKKLFQDIQNKFADETFSTELNYKKSLTYFTQSKYNLQQMKNSIFASLKNPSTLSPAEKEWSLTLLGLATGSVYSMAARVGTYLNQNGTSPKVASTLQKVGLDLPTLFGLGSLNGMKNEHIFQLLGPLSDEYNHSNEIFELMDKYMEKKLRYGISE